MRLWSSGERLAALRSYDILDTAAEVAFDDVVEIARTLTGAPVALISFVDADRQWFKARRGTELEGTGLDTSFCAIAVKEDVDTLVIPDAREDARTRNMAIVTGEPHVRAYAGVVLRSTEGAPLGTLCVLDVEPRAVSDAELGSLKALARQVSAQLELRRAALEKAEVAANLRDFNLGYELAMSAARLGRWDHRPTTGERYYDARARELMGVGAGGDISQEAMLARFLPEDRARVQAGLATVMNADRVGPLKVEARVADPASGEIRWLSVVGRTTFSDGVCTRFFGVIEDITDRKRAEEQRTLLTAELDHRVKNTLSLAQSVTDSTLRNAADLPSAREAVSARLKALAHAHDVLLAASWDAAPVSDLVKGAMSDLSLEGDRIIAEGPAVRLAARPALQLALALHELSTNAAKYGALSNDAGRVVIRWGLSGDAPERQRFEISWREEGGPPVRTPTRAGFGSRVLKRASAAAFHGEVALDYPPEGVRWSISAPMAALREGPPAAA